MDFLSCVPVGLVLVRGIQMTIPHVSNPSEGYPTHRVQRLWGDQENLWGPGSEQAQHDVFCIILAKTTESAQV